MTGVVQYERTVEFQKVVAFVTREEGASVFGASDTF